MFAALYQCSDRKFSDLMVKLAREVNSDTFEHFNYDLVTDRLSSILSVLAADPNLVIHLKTRHPSHIVLKQADAGRDPVIDAEISRLMMFDAPNSPSGSAELRLSGLLVPFCQNCYAFVYVVSHLISIGVTYLTLRIGKHPKR